MSRRQVLMLAAASYVAPLLAQPALAASAGVAPPALPVGAVPIAPPPPVVMDKKLTRELGRGRLIDEIARRKRPPTPWKADEKLLQPFAAAAVGAPTAVQLAQGTELANAPAAQALCEQVLARLLAGWTGTQPELTVRIAAEPFYRARATDSGVILVSLGVFDKDYGIRSEDELALLIGHEVAHMLLDHLGDRKAVAAVGQALSLVGGSFTLYSAAANSQMVGRQLNVRSDPKLLRSSLIGSLASTTLLQDLLAPGATRGKELEADRLGIDLARKAKYVVEFDDVKMFVDHHSKDAELQSTRMAALSLLLSGLVAEMAGNGAGGSGAKLISGLLNVVGNQAIVGVAKFVASRTKEHVDPVERAEFLRKYMVVYQSEASGGLRAAAPARAIALRPDTQQMLARIRQAGQVEQRLIASAADTSGASTDRAVREMLHATGFSGATIQTVQKQRDGGKKGTARRDRKGAAPKPAATPAPAVGFADVAAPYTVRMQGLLQQAGGDAAGARTTWRRGLAAPLVPVPLAQQLGGAIRDPANAAELDALLTRYQRDLGTTDPLLDVAVASAVARGDQPAAELAAARCATFERGRLYPRCAAALGYDPLGKDGVAKTEEGRQAFAGKSLERTFQVFGQLADLF